MNEEKYLKVSEMGVEAETPEKTFRVTEVPRKKDPIDVEHERRKLGIERRLANMLMGDDPNRNATEAVRSLMYLNKAASFIDGYDNWKMLSFYLLGKLDGTKGADSE